ncbi:3'-5' exoribonuclease domain-containing protein [Xanthomonas campestris]|uniref:3'-5' exonuclease n=1 Tax=Xanthomonas campestris TaxID=339 RepID=UPI0015A1FAC3|nr:3'-5' exoribonuclease [Xanthomonas campestris]QLC68168.1 3'-5' exoribonuclease [Xanthomonas campestris pv. raphani]
MELSEIFVSVDIESSGPIPGEFSLLSIGAVFVDRPETSFYLELKPEDTRHDPEALAVTGFEIEELARNGVEPGAAMRKFGQWLSEFSAPSQRPIFVGLNAAFDWSFVNYYFHKYCGENPFGFTALDIKAFFMGVVGSRWDQTKSSQMEKLLRPKLTGTHNALEDARYQAELFRKLQKLRVSQG